MPPPRTTSLRKKYKRAKQIVRYTNIVSNARNDASSATTIADEHATDETESQTPSVQVVQVVPTKEVKEPLRRASAAFKRDRTLPVQNETEIKLFELAELGDVTGIRDLLFPGVEGNFNPSIDINKPNITGYTILHKAVQRGDENLVRLLLSLPDIDIQDTLFYAIKEQNMGFVKAILQHEIASIYQYEDAPEDDDSYSKSEYQVAVQSCIRRKNEMGSEFNDDITPVMLAAQVGSYELIKYFHEACGTELPKQEDIHSPECQCPKCKEKGAVGMALIRLHYFMAVSNPFYMIFLANAVQNFDPIMATFNMITMLKKYMRYENEFEVEYEELIKELKKFAADLLGLCRTTAEVDTMLSQKNGYEGDTRRYPRLFMAVLQEQKEFVAHPHAQEALSREWFGEWRDRKNMSARIGNTILQLCAVIFCGLWLIVDDESDNAKKFAAPVARYVNHVTSYIIFLSLIVCALVFETDPNDESVPRTYELAVIEWLIFIFVLGHICSTIKQLAVMPRTFIRLPWTWYDILTHIAFILTFIFWLKSWLDAPEHHHRKKERWERQYWEPYHPLLIAEGFFAIASIMSFGRVLRLFKMSSRLGPMQIYLGNMLRKGGLPIILSVLFIFAGATGFTSLYKEYAGLKSKDQTDPDAEEEEQTDKMASIPKAMHSLLWAMLGLPNNELVQLLTLHGEVETVKVDKKGVKHTFTKRVDIHHGMTETVGTVMYAMFLVVAVTVMLNTVISMMTGAGGAALDNRDMEWKFARSQMYIFIGADTKVPSPYNIFRVIFSFIKYCALGGLGKLFGKKRKHVDSSKELASYAKLVKHLCRRYFYNQADVSLKESGTTDQVTSLREMVCGLKDKYRALTLGAYLGDRRLAHLQSRRSLPSPEESVESTPSPSQSRIEEQVNEMVGSAVGKMVAAPPPPPLPSTPPQPPPVQRRPNN